MSGPTPSFWQQRFESNNVPWDRGSASPQLAAWLAEGRLRAGQNVIVPGCGSGYEVEALAAAGCRVSALDVAPAALARTRERLAARSLPAELHEADVLRWQPESPADAVYEQTCLCALHPDDWVAYAAQLHAWLKPGGLLCALFLQARRESAAQGIVEGPPYHSDINAMRALFPSTRWQWPRPPYAEVPHPRGWTELPVVLERLP
jgi:SAM-dependent methyltransferase